ncbi:type IV pilin biogenesis protein [Enhygromyxa salina]|uniref:Type IV fimbrial biogenesis protein PilY1 n=1 Tax=Enhygromyxa salina TaxID=215803 RepID=A0A2S9YYR2_9BACT|nr:type IV pilin biogenesis protein [Enhygromyxa salina]PRQ10226.1 hypothetical protein ENSA7_00340 [Enhygromyxa salina]
MRKQHDKLSTRGHLLRWGLKLASATLLLFGLAGHAQQANARLDPFYIVHGASYGAISPRILFVLDNSGSMAMDETYFPMAPFPNTKCWWSNCEDASKGVLQSRVHAARDVISEIATTNSGRAEFALMTFGTANPPNDDGGEPVPDPCTAQATVGSVVAGETYRFTWVKNVNQPYSTQWKPATNAFGGQGFWVLCGDNRPFPYLRHDDLGGFSMPNNSNDPLLDQPLYQTESSLAAFESHANRERKVHWFPRFLGRRFNVDCADPYYQHLVNRSAGDYGSTDAAKQAAICGRDFYYWPYVDGHPGYSFYDGLSEDNMSHQECDDNAVCSTKTNQIHRTGVTRRNQFVGATLYAPFYSKAVKDDINIPMTEQGPRTQADADLMFNGIVDKTFAGGADAASGTPMAVAMGVPEYMVTSDINGNITGAKPAMTKSNRPFAQPTIASYLAFMRLAETDQLCRPMSMIIVTDGQPDPWASQGGTKLYQRLRSVRRLLGVKTYMVAYTEGVYDNPTTLEQTHNMACAAAGANDTTNPCAGGNDHNDWDTCNDPTDPVNGCAWLSSDHTELSEALTKIITREIQLDVPSGTPTVANDFQLSDPNNPESSQAAVQTSISSWTEAPGWTGHVARTGCTDEDPNNPGQLTAYCQNVADVPLDTDEVETFGPCPLSRVWDAGECLALTDWTARRIYTHDLSNNVIRVTDGGGVPTPEFVALVEALDGLGRITPALSANGPQKTAEIVAMAEWLQGRNMPDNWKLAGTPNSAPILIRRVPKQNPSFLPSVGIRDPHCAGRRNAQGDEVPDSLKSFSSGAWQIASGGGFGDHYDYAEAVLIGDDFGMLHGFHYDSGNELFGFVPAALLTNSRKLSIKGPESFGQGKNAKEHLFGIASTVNTGWAFDKDAGKWRHLAVFGLGPGGTEIMTLDVSHMGRLQDDDPIEVVWTTSTAANAADYAATLGQTWSRPALTYAAPNHEMSLEPTAYMVFGSGYRNGVGDVERGRTVWVVDAMTGETVTQRAYVAPPVASSYDVLDDLTQASDIAVGSHCLSRYWGEMQEAYWVDNGGRLFRWDLATETSDVTTFPHTGDSGGVWPQNLDGFSVATEAFRFPACAGTGTFSCSIAANNKGDVFSFSPAVVANNRIDEINDPGTILPLEDRDQFLIALASGNPNDNAIDSGDEENDFHSSIYMLTDDHVADQSAGFDIPANAPTTAPGAHAHFMRLPLNQIERTRTIYYPDGTDSVEVRNFGKAARPIRAPMIRVTGLADGTNQADAEVYYVSYTIYEPGNQSCDSRWFDDNTGEWVTDPGATYDITFRLINSGNDPFDFTNGYSLPADFNDGFGTGGGLSGPVVRQQECEGDNCGAVLKAPKTSPCDPNEDAPPAGGAVSVQVGYSELAGFSPLEVEF